MGEVFPPPSEDGAGPLFSAYGAQATEDGASNRAEKEPSTNGEKEGANGSASPFSGASPTSPSSSVRGGGLIRRLRRLKSTTVQRQSNQRRRQRRGSVVPKLQDEHEQSGAGAAEDPKAKLTGGQIALMQKKHRIYSDTSTLPVWGLRKVIINPVGPVDGEGGSGAGGVYVNEQTPNVLKSTKYTKWNLIPLNLYEQLHRLSNLWFLIVSAIQIIHAGSSMGNSGVSSRFATAFPLAVLLSLTMAKDLYEDLRRRQIDKIQSSRRTRVVDPSAPHRLLPLRWGEVRVGDVLQLLENEECPADVVLLSSSHPEGVVFVNTIELDGSAELKKKWCVKETKNARSPHAVGSIRGRVLCGRHHMETADLDVFGGSFKLDAHPRATTLTAANLMFRGSSLRLTHYCYCVVVFTGRDTRLARGTRPVARLSVVEKEVNRFVLFVLMVIFTCVLVSTVAYSAPGVFGTGNNVFYYFNLLGQPLNDSENIASVLVSFILLYNNLIPIAIMVTVDIVRWLQVFLMEADPRLRAIDQTGAVNTAQVRSPNLNETLGLADFVLCDKTGTLTNNQLRFRLCSVAGRVYGLSQAARDLVRHPGPGPVGGRPVAARRPLPITFPENARPALEAGEPDTADALTILPVGGRGGGVPSPSRQRRPRFGSLCRSEDFLSGHAEVAAQLERARRANEGRADLLAGDLREPDAVSLDRVPCPGEPLGFGLSSQISSGTVSDLGGAGGKSNFREDSSPGRSPPDAAESRDAGQSLDSSPRQRGWRSSPRARPAQTFGGYIGTPLPPEHPLAAPADSLGSSLDGLDGVAQRDEAGAAAHLTFRSENILGAARSEPPAAPQKRRRAHRPSDAPAETGTGGGNRRSGEGRSGSRESAKDRSKDRSKRRSKDQWGQESEEQGELRSEERLKSRSKERSESRSSAQPPEDGSRERARRRSRRNSTSGAAERAAGEREQDRVGGRLGSASGEALSPRRRLESADGAGSGSGGGLRRRSRAERWSSRSPSRGRGLGSLHRSSGGVDARETTAFADNGLVGWVHGGTQADSPNPPVRMASRGAARQPSPPPLARRESRRKSRRENWREGRRGSRRPSDGVIRDGTMEVFRSFSGNGSKGASGYGSAGGAGNDARGSAENASKGVSPESLLKGRGRSGSGEGQRGRMRGVAESRARRPSKERSGDGIGKRGAKTRAGENRPVESRPLAESPAAKSRLSGIEKSRRQRRRKTIKALDFHELFNLSQGGLEGGLEGGLGGGLGRARFPREEASPLSLREAASTRAASTRAASTRAEGGETSSSPGRFEATDPLSVGSLDYSADEERPASAVGSAAPLVSLGDDVPLLLQAESSMASAEIIKAEDLVAGDEEGAVVDPEEARIEAHRTDRGFSQPSGGGGASSSKVSFETPGRGKDVSFCQASSYSSPGDSARARGGISSMDLEELARLADRAEIRNASIFDFPVHPVTGARCSFQDGDFERELITPSPEAGQAWRAFFIHEFLKALALCNTAQPFVALRADEISAWSHAGSTTEYHSGTSSRSKAGGLSGDFESYVSVRSRRNALAVPPVYTPMMQRVMRGRRPPLLERVAAELCPGRRKAAPTAADGGGKGGKGAIGAGAAGESAFFDDEEDALLAPLSLHDARPLWRRVLQFGQSPASQLVAVGRSSGHLQRAREARARRNLERLRSRSPAFRRRTLDSSCPSLSDSRTAAAAPGGAGGNGSESRSRGFGSSGGHSRGMRRRSIVEVNSSVMPSHSHISLDDVGDEVLFEPPASAGSGTGVVRVRGKWLPGAAAAAAGAGGGGSPANFSPGSAAISRSAASAEYTRRLRWDGSLRCRLVYESESPDEECLVSAAASVGYYLVARSARSVALDVQGELQSFEILGLNAWTSERRRTSVAVRRRFEGRRDCVLYCIGADIEILPLLRLSPQLLVQVRRQTERFSRRGFRTLLVAHRRLSPLEATQFERTFQEARQAIYNRAERVEAAAASIEKDLRFVGIAAVSDSLQARVPAVIESLKMCGSRLWLVTGDSASYSVRVATAAGLTTPGAAVMYADFVGGFAGVAEAEESSGRRRREGFEILARFRRTRLASRSMCLVVHGVHLALWLSCTELQTVFLLMACSSDSVVFARMTASQKALVVRLLLTRLSPPPVVVAVGDGANDVAMLNASNCGIAINGGSGSRQASNSSDYTVPGFSQVAALLLIHGRFNYLRLTQVVTWFFFKSYLLVLPLFWHCPDSGWSSAQMYNNEVYMLFNLLFTSLPIFVAGAADWDVPENAALYTPILYCLGRRRAYLNPGRIFLTFLEGAVWSGIIYAFTREALRATTISHGAFGFTVFTLVTCGVNLKQALILRAYSTPWLVLFAITLLLYPMTVTILALAVPDANLSMSVLREAVGTPLFWALLLLVITVLLQVHMAFRWMTHRAVLAVARDVRCASGHASAHTLSLECARNAHAALIQANAKFPFESSRLPLRVIAILRSLFSPALAPSVVAELPSARHFQITEPTTAYSAFLRSPNGAPPGGGPQPAAAPAALRAVSHVSLARSLTRQLRRRGTEWMRMMSRRLLGSGGSPLSDTSALRAWDPENINFPLQPDLKVQLADLKVQLADLAPGDLEMREKGGAGGKGLPASGQPASGTSDTVRRSSVDSVVALGDLLMAVGLRGHEPVPDPEALKGALYEDYRHGVTLLDEEVSLASTASTVGNERLGVTSDDRKQRPGSTSIWDLVKWYDLRFQDRALEAEFQQRWREQASGNAGWYIFLLVLYVLVRGIVFAGEVHVAWTCNSHVQFVTGVMTLLFSGLNLGAVIWKCKPVVRSFDRFLTFHIAGICALMVVEALEGKVRVGSFCIIIPFIVIARLEFARSSVLGGLALVLLIVAQAVVHEPAASVVLNLPYALGILIFAGFTAHRIELNERRRFLLHFERNAAARRQREILNTMLPSFIVNRVLETNATRSAMSLLPAEDRGTVTVIFCDVYEFQSLVSAVEPTRLVEVLDSLFLCFDRCTEQFRCTKIETVFETYLCATGLRHDGTQSTNPRDDALDAVELALAMLEVCALIRYEVVNAAQTRVSHRVRCKVGIHSGRVISGVVGTVKPQYALFGDTVNTASRMKFTGSPDKVHVSAATHDLVAHDLSLEWLPRTIQVKGKGSMRTYLLESVFGSRYPFFGGGHSGVEAGGATGPATGPTPPGAPPPPQYQTAAIHGRTPPRPRPKRGVFSAEEAPSERYGRVKAAMAAVERSLRRVSVFQPEGAAAATTAATRSDGRSTTSSSASAGTSRRGGGGPARGGGRSAGATTARSSRRIPEPPSAKRRYIKFGPDTDIQPRLNHSPGLADDEPARPWWRRRLLCCRDAPAEINGDGVAAGADASFFAGAKGVDEGAVHSQLSQGTNRWLLSFRSSQQEDAYRSAYFDSRSTLANVEQLLAIFVSIFFWQNVVELLFVSRLTGYYTLQQLSLRNPDLYWGIRAVFSVAYFFLWGALHYRTRSPLQSVRGQFYKGSRTLYLLFDVTQIAAACIFIISPTWAIRYSEDLIEWTNYDMVRVAFYITTLHHNVTLLLTNLIWMDLLLFMQLFIYILVVCEYTPFSVAAVGFAAGVFAFNIIATHQREKAERLTWFAGVELLSTGNRADKLLHDMLPSQVLREFQQDRLQLAYRHDRMTFLFADICGFTSFANSVDATEVVSMLQELFSDFDQETTRFGLFKLCTIGDAYVAVTQPVTEDNLDWDPAVGAERILEMATAMIYTIREVRVRLAIPSLDMRIGLHYGRCVGGVIGSGRLRYDLWGLDVLTGNLMESNGVPGRIALSGRLKHFLEQQFPRRFKFIFHKTVPVIHTTVKAYLLAEEAVEPLRAQVAGGARAPSGVSFNK